MYDEIWVCTIVYENKKLNRTRINGLPMLFELCVYDVYDEIDQNSEKIKKEKWDAVYYQRDDKWDGYILI